MSARRSDHTEFRRVTIVGVGLIGGSLGLAIQHRFPSCVVTGVDRPEVLRTARRRGAIHHGETSVARGVREADLVILAAPMPAILRLLPVVGRSVSSRAIVTDTGSVKSPVRDRSRTLFPGGNFIGGHPMTGAEFSGVRAAHPLLFENAFCVLCPSRAANRSALRRLARFYGALGSRVVVLPAEEHDRAVAALSHVPQLAAVALMRSAAAQPLTRSHLRLGAGGFRDMTRIASSPFALWKDILLQNRREVRGALARFVKELQRSRRALAGGTAGLASQFREAARLRAQIPRGMKGLQSHVPELTVYLPDRPGSLAAVTSALARNRVNIKDLELLKVREGTGGTFRMAFESSKERARARRILARAVIRLESR